MLCYSYLVATSKEGCNRTEQVINATATLMASLNNTGGVNNVRNYRNRRKTN